MTTAGNAALARAWDEAADGYDAYFVPRFAPWVADAAGALEDVDLPPGPIVVPCCGTLPELPHLERVQPGRRVIGIDLSTGMVERARTHYGVRAELLVGDAVSLDALAERPAAIVSVFGLQQLPDPVGALRGWEDAILPGGTLSVMWWPPVVETSGPYALLTNCVEKNPMTTGDSRSAPRRSRTR